METHQLNGPILGLDLALQTGWAWSDRPPAATRPPALWHVAARGRRIRAAWPKASPLADVDLPSGRATRVRHARPLEDAGFGSHNPSVKDFHGQLKGIALMCAEELRAQVYLIGPSTLKAFFTGSGRARKTRWCACKTHFGILPRNDDEADAIALLLAASFQNVRASTAGKSRSRDGLRKLKLCFKRFDSRTNPGGHGRSQRPNLHR